MVSNPSADIPSSVMVCVLCSLKCPRNIEWKYSPLAARIHLCAGKILPCTRMLTSHKSPFSWNLARREFNNHECTELEGDADLERQTDGILNKNPNDFLWECTQLYCAQPARFPIQIIKKVLVQQGNTTIKCAHLGILKNTEMRPTMAIIMPLILPFSYFE